ncbi:MAG TPA: VCBS repeat-containing protein, partial [Pyrinomonadaceae bacterium]|nr:VCBS repeat-containing protein [Pyrinomonadaceae bacterium]
GDGDRDVLTLANSSAAVTVHLNPGNGVFPVLPRYEVASLSDAVESADIDNDGDIDVVVNGELDIASNAPLLKILKNNGNGTFAPATDYTPTRNFGDMKLRDINRDGFVDLVFAPDRNYPNYHFGTALNLGNGTFAPTVVTNVFSCGEGTIDAADLDGDGDRDIVLTEEQGCAGGQQNRIFVFRNDGSQVFTRMTDIVVAGLPHGLELADATGDGKLDIITAQSQGIGVYPGNGNLTFGAVILTTIQPYKFRVADFNRDGKIDIGMIMPQPSFGTDKIATSLGNGNGTFQAIRSQTGSSVFENLRISDDLEARDMNGDAIPDIVVFNYASNDVSLFVGNADGSLQPHQRYGIGNTPRLGTVADFDGDGRIDIAAAIGLPPSGLHNAIVLLRNTAQASTRKVPFDFDGDGKTDIGIFRPAGAASEWWINRSSTGQTFALQFGAAADKIAPADYTGDGKTDVAFFRPSSGQWFVLRSEDFSFFALPFGAGGDVPVPADYDADGKADFAVFRASSSTWFISQSSGASTRILQFGTAGDQPVVADYDADGKADVGIVRPAAGGAEWWIDRSTAGLLAMQFGANTDKAVPGDYTGDGKADVAIWRPSTGQWLIVRSEDSSFYGFPFGMGSDVPAPGDYDGDGKFDGAVFRPSSATWFIGRTTGGTQIVQFGANGDRPIPNSFVP